MKRREFLKRIGAAGIALPFVSGLGSVRAFAQSPSVHSGFARATGNSSARNRVLVIVRLFGGNDGLNTVVPYTDENYYLARRKDAVYSLALDANAVLPLPKSDSLAFHPALAPLVPLYSQEKICIVQNVGYPNQDLSHFRSNDIWLSATDADIYDDSGWLGRYLENHYPDYPYVLPQAPYAIEIGTLIGRSLIGHKNTMGFTLADTSYIPDNPEAQTLPFRKESREEEFVRENMRQSNVFLTSIVAAQARQPANTVQYANSKLSSDLASVARLIAGGLSTSIYIVNTGLYDFHTNQLQDQHRMLAELADAMSAFHNDMQKLGVSNRVATMTISEFGRRVTPGGSGTDHGAASMLFVLGDGVKGGVVGSNPNISDVDGEGNLRYSIDFRQVYASVLSQWLDTDYADMVPSLYRNFKQLPIFRGNSMDPIVFGALPTQLRLHQNVPNPASDFTTVEIDGMPFDATASLVVCDNVGRVVQHQSVNASQRTLIIDTRAMAPGAYSYELRINETRITRKMIVIR